jgi:hypothetical protein
MMHPVSANTGPSTVPGAALARRAPLGRRQRALLLQFQALSYLMLFLGLFCGLFLAGGASVLGAFCLLLSLVLLEPLALSAASAREGHYRISALFGMLGATAYAVVACLMLFMPFGDFALLTQVGPLVTRLAAAGLLTGAAVTTLRAARALWGASDSPSAIGPGAGVPDPRALPAGATKSA